MKAESPKPSAMAGIPPHTLIKIGAALLEWFDDGHPSITADALQRWAGVDAPFLVRLGYLERIPAAELPPGAPEDFYRLNSGFRALWANCKAGMPGPN